VPTVSYQPADSSPKNPGGQGETQAHRGNRRAALPDLITLDTIDHFRLAD
jgi:hypothetical protein